MTEEEKQALEKASKGLAGHFGKAAAMNECKAAHHDGVSDHHEVMAEAHKAMCDHHMGKATAAGELLKTLKTDTPEAKLAKMEEDEDKAMAAFHKTMHKAHMGKAKMHKALSDKHEAYATHCKAMQDSVQGEGFPGKAAGATAADPAADALAKAAADKAAADKAALAAAPVDSELVKSFTSMVDRLVKGQEALDKKLDEIAKQPETPPVGLTLVPRPGQEPLVKTTQAAATIPPATGTDDLGF